MKQCITKRRLNEEVNGMVVQSIERIAYSPAEAAAAIGLSTGSIYALVKTGELPALKKNRKILISADHLRAYVNQETAKRKSFLERIKGV